MIVCHELFKLREEFKQVIFHYCSLAFCLSYSMEYNMQYGGEYCIADWGWPTIGWFSLILLHNSYCFETYHF